MMLTELPQEVVEELAAYLSLSDVLSCSAVNRDWRNVFNSNRVWRRFCSFHPSYFCNQVSKVDHSDTQVSDVCEARQQLFKEQSVQKNFLNGLYHVARLENLNTYCDNVVDHVDEVGNHWLFISCMKNLDFESKHVLSVWNLNDSPRLHISVETPLGLTSRRLDTEMKVEKNRLFYVLKRVVLVYEFSNPDYELKFLHKIEHLLFPETAMVLCNSQVLGFFYSEYHVLHSIAPSISVWDGEGLLTFTDCDFRLFSEQLAKRHGCPFPFLTAKAGSSTILVVYRNMSGFFVLKQLISRTHEYKEIGTFVSTYCHEISGNTVSVAVACPQSVYCHTFHSDVKNIFGPTEVDPSFPLSVFKLLLGNEGRDVVLLLNNCVSVFDVLRGDCVNTFKLHHGDLKNVTIWKRNILVCQFTFRKSGKTFSVMVDTEIWDYKSGQQLYMLDLFPEFGFQQSVFNFSFVQSYSSPPKIIAFQDPLMTYAHNGKGNKVLVISFW